MAQARTTRLPQGTPVVVEVAEDPVYASDAVAGLRGVVRGVDDAPGAYRVHLADGGEVVVPRERLTVAWLRDDEAARRARERRRAAPNRIESWLAQHTAPGPRRRLRIVALVAITALGVALPVADAVRDPTVSNLGFVGWYVVILVYAAVIWRRRRARGT